MRKNTRNGILFMVILVLLTVAIIAFNLYNEGPVNVQESKAIDTDPVSLYTTYLTDSIEAHKKFDGKIIRLTGEISGISENNEQQQIVLIKTSAAGGSINCTMSKPVRNILAGNRITVKGICSGIGEGDAELGIAGDVYLIRTIIVN